MLTRALLCAMCALGVGATPALAAFPGHNGKIAFASIPFDFSGPDDIYTMSPNGGQVVNLTNSPTTAEFGPKWSPDGRRIVFMSDRVSPSNPDGNLEVFVMNADGSGQRQVTSNALHDAEPSWSPDGERIVFERVFGDFDYDLFTIRPDGDGERQLTYSPGIPDQEAAWSPDGREIAFSHGGDAGSGRGDIYTIRPDGSHMSALTVTDADEEYPAWSPDGRQIAFTSDREARDRQFDVYAIRRNGSHPTQLTTAECGAPAYSPDGRKLVCGSNRSGDSEIWKMRADGSRPRNLTQNPMTHDGFPDWQPLGDDEHAADDD
jgi:Tol biopolymer transport system component